MAAGEQQQSANDTERIKAEVRNTIRQLSELTRTEHNFDQFCQAVLTRVVQLTGAHGALLWQVNGSGKPAITHAAGERSKAVTENAEAHQNLVINVVENQKPLGLPSDSLNGQQKLPEGVDPVMAKFLMLFSPVFNRMEKCCGSIELLQRNDITPSAQEGYLRFLTQISQLFPRWHEQRDLAVLTDGAEKWNKKLEFTKEVHRSIDKKETTYAIANEVRRLLGCDRVSVATWNGSSCKISAISSQDRFDNRANVVRKLGNVATASVKADSKFWIIGNTEGIAPEVARKINDYLDESHSRTLAVIPLAKRPSDAPDLEMNKSKKEKPVKLGALIVEYFDTDVTEARIADECELMTTHAQLALESTRKHSQIFMMPLWQKIGWLQSWLFKDHFSKTMVVLGCLGALLLAMLLVQKEHKIGVDGVMNPAERQWIYAETDGTIRKVLPDAGVDGVVNEGDLLIELENIDVADMISDVKGQIEQNAKNQQNLYHTINSGRDVSSEEKTRANGDLNLLKAQLDFQKSKLALLERKQQAQSIFAPMNGKVLTWEADRLMNLPVSMGTRLLQIASLEKDWEIELKIAQQQIGYVERAIAESDEPPTVEFQMSTNPNVRFMGKLIKVSDRPELSEMGEPEYRALVLVDKEQVDKLNESKERRELKPSAGVTAKIHVGKKSMGFCWFYQVYDYLRYNLFL